MTKWTYVLICLRMRGETAIMANNSSPHKARNHQGIANAVLKYLDTPATSNQAAVLVEGSDDAKIYQKFLNQNMTQIFACIGKNDLQRALSALVTQTDRVIGIRDADFSNLEHIRPETPNLFFTDGHDIEMTILKFKEVRRALFFEYYNKDHLDRIDSVWESIFKDASFAGYIRWFNEKNNYKITFDGLFYKIDRDGDKEQLLIDQLNKQSPDKKKPLTKEMINDFIIACKTDDIFNLCNGHDVTALFVKAFNISPKQFVTALSLSFHQEQFFRTALCQDLLAWQTNHGIAILYSSCEEATNG
jgi:hypothetical protein